MHYRNKIELTSYEGVDVEAESLWIKKGELMVLVDEDQHCTTVYSEVKFYKVEIQ